MNAPQIFGQSVPRVEDAPLLRGRGKFVDDIHYPDMLQAAFVRSAYAHALIKGIDAAAAKAVPGVHAVLTMADLRPYLKQDRLPLHFPHPAIKGEVTPVPLADKETVFVGEAIAVVIADTRYIAEDAAMLVQVDYEPLPAIGDCKQAIAPDAPVVDTRNKSNILADLRQSYGDVETAFATAPHRLSFSIKQHRGHGLPLEGRGTLANYDDREDRLTLWMSSQMAHEAQAFLMRMLGLNDNQLRVVTPDIGGGFGAKFQLYPEDVAVAIACRLLNRPVKWTEDRREHLIACVQEHDQYWDMEIAYDGEGRLLGARGQLINDQGAYSTHGISLAWNSSTNFPNVYNLPAYDLRIVGAKTNKVTVIGVRGAGYPQAAFAMEYAIDRVARALKMDRAEIRRRNLIRPEQLPYERPIKARSGAAMVLDSGDYPRAQKILLNAIDYAGFAARQSCAREEGRYIGIGIANGIKGTGRGPFEQGLVKVDRSGKITVFTGAVQIGQGIKTAFAQVCAEQFGVDPSDVTVVTGDTGTPTQGLGAYASRQTVMAGSAVHLAALAVRDKAIRVAAHLLEASVEDVEMRNGRVEIKGAAGSGMSLGEIANVMAGIPGYALPPGFDPGLESKQSFMGNELTFGLGSHAVEVEVDIGTGNVKILRYVVVHDCGRAINPMMVDGQIIGGAIHGIGNALFERMGYDQNAQPVTTTLAEYLVPMAAEMPSLELIADNHPSLTNPLGVKGVGENGTVPATIAVISAIEHALTPFDVQITDVPISPPSLVELIHRGQTAARRS